MRHLFEIDGCEHSLWLSRETNGYKLHLEDATVRVSLAAGCLHIDGSTTPVHVAQAGDGLFVHIDGDTHELLYHDPISRHAAGPEKGAQDVLRAPMPGVVVALPIETGQAIKEGDILLVIESMKLETVIRAPRDGLVEMVHLGQGDGFDRDAQLITLAPLQPTP